MKRRALVLLLVLLLAALLACSVDAALGGRYGFACGTNTQWQLGLPLNSSLNAHVALHPYEMPLFAASGIEQVAAGITHTVAITSWGSTYRWGFGDRGQLGGRLLSPMLQSPETLLLLEDMGSSSLRVWSRTVNQIAVGAAHTVAVVDDNQLFAWGDNRFNQLGGPAPPRVVRPTITTIPARNITLGFNGTLNATATGNPNATHSNRTWIRPAQKLCSTANCSNIVEPRDFSSSPIAVPGVTTQRIVTVVCNMHRSAVLTAEGKIWVWGDNRDGLSGVDSDADFLAPSQVDTPFTAATQLAMGTSHFVALDGDGRVWVWGSNAQHQLGLGDHAPAAVDVPTESKFFADKHITNITAGYHHTIAWSEVTKRAYAFGDNEYGQLGISDMKPHNCPEEIAVLQGVDLLAVSAGRAHNLVLSRSGSVLVWGLNNQGQLGIGDTTTRHTPTRLIALESKGLHRAAAGYTTSFFWTGPQQPPPPPTYDAPVTTSITPASAGALRSSLTSPP